VLFFFFRQVEVASFKNWVWRPCFAVWPAKINAYWLCGTSGVCRELTFRFRQWQIKP